jgi:hypothetical protein
MIEYSNILILFLSSWYVASIAQLIISGLKLVEYGLNKYETVTEGVYNKREAQCASPSAILKPD